MTDSPKKDPAKGKKKRVRSPRFPFISLETALERARTFQQIEKHHAARVEIAASHWDMSPKSSSLLQTIGALKQYGLMEDEGAGQSRTLKLTDLARRILLDEREDGQERDQAIKQAALSPTVFQELWEKWGAEQPSEASFRTHLIMDRGFNDATANVFIGVYRDTVTFADLSDSDKEFLDPGDTTDLDNDTPVGKGAKVDTTTRSSNRDRHFPPPPPASEQQYMVVRLAGGRTFRVVGDGPEPTQKVWAKLIKHLELSQDEFPEEEPVDDA